MLARRCSVPVQVEKRLPCSAKKDPQFLWKCPPPVMSDLKAREKATHHCAAKPSAPRDVGWLLRHLGDAACLVRTPSTLVGRARRRGRRSLRTLRIQGQNPPFDHCHSSRAIIGVRPDAEVQHCHKGAMPIENRIPNLLSASILLCF